MQREAMEFDVLIVGAAPLGWECPECGGTGMRAI